MNNTELGEQNKAQYDVYFLKKKTLVEYDFN